MKQVTNSVWLWMSLLGICLPATLAVADQNGSDIAELELSAEVLALRSEVRELRADIRRLIEHLQAEQGKQNRETLEVANAPSLSDGQATVSNDFDFVDMTLADCLTIALQNIGKQRRLQADWLMRAKDVHAAYWDLWVATKRLEGLRNAREASLNLWRLSIDRSEAPALSPEVEKQARAFYKQCESLIAAALFGSTVPGNDPLGLLGREQLLREKMGWTPREGAMIRPTETPTVTSASMDWENVRDEAMKNNPTTKSIRTKIDQLESELASAKQTTELHLHTSYFWSWLGIVETDNLVDTSSDADQYQEPLAEGYSKPSSHLESRSSLIGRRRELAKIRSIQIQLAKHNEQLRDAEVSLLHNLTQQWRKLGITVASIGDYRDQRQANVREIQIYQVKIDQGDVQQFGELSDLLLRAEERRARSESQFVQAIGELHKAVASIHWLCGSASMSDVSFEFAGGPPQPNENSQQR